MVRDAQWNHYLVLGHDHGDPRGDSRDDHRGYIIVFSIAGPIMFC